MTGAADDRSFVLDVRQFPWSSTWFAVTPRTWYLLKIAPGTAHPTRLTKLRIPATPNGAQVDGMALSPNGREFAVMYQPNAMAGPGPVTLRIYSMATGKTVHTWVGPAPSPSGPGDYLFGQYLYLDDNATLSWASDGRSLAFVYGAGLITDTTVRTLKLASSGHGLLSGSKLVLGLKPGSAPDCSSLMVTANGRTVVCGAALGADAARPGLFRRDRPGPTGHRRVLDRDGQADQRPLPVHGELHGRPSGRPVGEPVRRRGARLPGNHTAVHGAVPRWEVPGRPIHRRLIQAAVDQAGRRDAYGRNDRLLVTIAF